MDIDLLSRIVKELITDHDKVGLPGLGTFVAEVVPASFSDKGYTINPPYRRLSFHPDNTEADLLVKFYSDSNHVPLEASRVYITEFLSELKQVLIQRKTVIFPGLGRLRATKENNFFFVPDEDLDIYPDGFGLQPVSMKYIQGVADPVDIKLSYSDAMRGFEDRHRAAGEPQLETLSPDQAEPVQPVAEGQPVESELTSEPVQPSDPGQSSESELTSESGQSSEPMLQAEPVQPVAEQAQHQPEAGVQVRREEESGAEMGQSFEPGQSAASQVQPVAEGQPTEPTQPDEPVQPGAEQAQHQAEAEEQVPREEEPGSEMGHAEPMQPEPVEPGAEPMHHTAPAQLSEDQAELQGEESDVAPAELPGEETGVVRRRCRWWIAPVVVLSLAVVALGVFVILAHAAPDFIDSILYTPEELKILNY